MSEVKWIKITTDIFDDEKILLIESMPEADSIIVIWFKLLTLAGKSNNNGVFIIADKIPYTDEMLATIFRRPINTVRLALQTFEQFGMIEIVNKVISIVNWDKHQNIDGLEKIREQTRKRVAEHRSKHKSEPCNVTCNVTVTDDCNVTVTQCNATDKNRIEKKRKEKNTNTCVFVRPSVVEVAQYCAERHNNIDPEAFIDFYESKGWMVGKNKMKDWKAAVRNWERDRKNKPTNVQIGIPEYIEQQRNGTLPADTKASEEKIKQVQEMQRKVKDGVKT